MTIHIKDERDQLDMLTTDQLLAEDHLVRKFAAAFDFNVIECCSNGDCLSFEPIVHIFIYSFNISIYFATLSKQTGWYTGGIH